MTRREYTDRVAACLRGPTKAELEAIRAELDAHIEDHICALLDLGYDEVLAEERTMALMGDPEEVGRELDKQYPLRWLLLKWAAMLVSCVLAVMLVTQVSWINIWWNLRYRLASEPVSQYGVETFTFLREHPVDVRMEIDDVVVRACAAGIMKTADYPYWSTWEDMPDTVHMAAITLCAYSADWRDLEIEQSVPDMFQVEGSLWSAWISGSKTTWLVPVELGQESITATYQRYGYDVSMEIPLDWEGVE